MNLNFECPPARLYESACDFGIREDLVRAEDTVLTTRRFEGGDTHELAVGVVAEGGYVNGFVPVLDVARFAAVHCPKALAKMLVQSGLAQDLKRELDEALADFDMEEGN